MIVRKMRLERGWSQSQLAEMAGVTTRTNRALDICGSSGSRAYIVTVGIASADPESVPCRPAPGGQPLSRRHAGTARMAEDT